LGERKLEYKDSKGQDCYFYYSNIAGTDLDMLGYVPVADIESEVTDWSIVLLVSGMKKRESKSETFSANPFEYEFLYAPLGDKGAYAYQQPWYGFSVNKDSEEKEIAVEFLRFMMQEKEIDEMASIKGLPSVAENGTDERYAGLRDAKNIEASFINDGSVPDSIRAALEQVCNDFGAGVYGNANEAVQAFVELCAEK
jgi:ABC-type glycerol-3-phosphate transport system substrate-binding protein